MPMRPDPDTLAWASAAVRHLARTTNLLIAARRFRIIGGDPRDAAALDALLTALGARAAAADERIDHLWCLGTPEQSATAVQSAIAVPAADQPRGHTLVVIDAGRHQPAVDEDAFGPVTPVRPGVLGVPMTSDDVSLVSTGREPEDDPAAEARLRWARRAMPVSRAVAAELRDQGLLRGTRIGVAMVLEPKTAVLSLLLREAGAEVVVYAHADETDDAVAAVLRRTGLPVFADSSATLDEQKALALAMLDTRPHVLLDDGAHVIRLAHQERPDLLPTMVGAAEETTSGLTALRVLADRGQLGIPVVAVNDARTKTFFDNRYGTGQSTVFAVLDLVDALPSGTHTVRPGGSAVVVGYGHVGEGVALVLRALGFHVTVAETDPVRALQARFAGHAVAPLIEAVRDADLVMSATGVADTITVEVLRACAADAVVAVAGGVDQEIAIDAALATGAERVVVGRKAERFTFPGAEHGVLVLDDGGCINITAAEGNPIEIMDLSFAVQLGAVRMLLERGDELDRAVVPVDPAVDDATARAALAAFGSRAEPPVPVAAQPADRQPDVRTTRFGAPA
ncbi:adenosylhomocysteinase [Curtobacterium sp. VKM Ac-2922]|uniref:adenosylhomocysteinase n=1 Tax=Curtobacterium sp. VKM Ac-2922 TaxID=2929475 RepID=UPI001FB27387|nr:adenosylhomocysteinase [Curtobacterium sp. VKM Ac-2922]MCJ1714434.1 adenosylhomocysteinase [Curtobacterium sp. VKM Ac-2922]